MIETFARNIPATLKNKSGSVFYSGRAAFSGRCKLYILGLNPGGDPTRQAKETVAWHTQQVISSKPDFWSEYRDESWADHPRGKFRMQPKVLHLLDKLGLDPGEVPSSNVFFVRSAGERDIAGYLDQYAEACWPFHEAVIKSIQPRAILCFGSKAGNFVRRKTGASKQIDQFVEEYPARSWASTAFINRDGLRVISVTHPGRANWRDARADPSGLVKRSLDS